MKPPRRRDLGMWAALIVLPLLAYSPLVHAGFIWDDDTTVTANPVILAADGLHKIWFSTQVFDYWPITYSCLWLEHHWFGSWAAGYHLVSLLLHLSECILIWRILVRLKLPGAGLAALLFALHPLNVESVAWIAQRKNLLGLLFVLLGFRAFAESEVPAGGKPDRWCALAVAAGVAAMLSKASAAPYPLVLAGWVALRRRLRWSDAGWLGLLLAATAGLVGVNLWYAHKWGGEVIRVLTPADRIAGAGAVIWFYLAKAILPIRLSFVYPSWTPRAAEAAWWLPLAAVLVLTAVLWLRRNRGLRPELTAWLYFGAMLIPVLGLTDVYFMRFSPVADHYVQMALVGAVAWAAYRFRRWGGPVWLAAAVVLACGALTFRQAATYRDTATLFRSVLARNPGSWMAQNNYGIVLQEQGDLAGAEAHYRAALALYPDYAEANNDLGVVLQVQGHVADALQRFRAAARLDPRVAQFHNNYSVALLLSGQPAAAEAEARAAVARDSGYAEGEFNLGNALRAEGRLTDALAAYDAAVKLRPTYAQAESAIGLVYCQLRQGPAALPHFERAHALAPANADFADYLKRLREALHLSP